MNFIENYFNEDSHPEQKISDAVFLGEINDKSKIFLEEKLTQIKNDGVVEDYEKDYIDNQIQYHKELNNTIEKYNLDKKYISNKSKTEINKLVEEINSQSLSSDEIDFLKNKIDSSKELLENKFFGENIRSITEDNIDIVGELESVLSNNKIDKFYELFSLYYLNLIEATYNKEQVNKLIQNGEKGLVLSETLTEKIIQKIIVENYDFMKNINYKIIVKLTGGKSKIINIGNVIKTLERASSRVYKIELLESNLRGDLNNNQEINKVLGLNIENNDELLKTYCEYLIESRIISKTDLLNIFENNNKDFNYLDYLNNYGFTEESENTYKDMIQRELLGTRIGGQNIKLDQEYINSNYQSIINNFEVFTKIILEVESSGRNTSNNSGSSARGYFQYMTGNNGRNGREQGKFSSLETALRRYYIEYSGETNLPNTKLEHHEDVPNWIVDFYNKDNLDTRDLNAQQQNDLFIIDLFNNNRTIKNSAGNRVGINDFLGLIAIGNVWGIKNAYKIFHHTSTDSITDQVLNRVVNKYQKELVKLD